MLETEVEKAQQTLTEAKRLDTGDGGEGSDAVRSAELVLEEFRLRLACTLALAVRKITQ